MKKTAVCCASSPAYVFALYVSLCTFFKKSPRLANEADVYVYAWNWDANLKRLISSCGPVQIVDYDIPLDIERTPQVMKFSPALFARFEGFNLLDKYERVVCLDSDILVQKELVGVREESPRNIGMTRDSCPTVAFNFLKPPEGYDFNRPCYNAGFLVLKRTVDKVISGGEIAAWLYKMLKNCADKIYLGDQGLINLALQEFNLTPYVFSPLYNLPASRSRKLLKQAYNVHSTGHRKFWCYYYFHEWYETYVRWRAAGGPNALRSDSAAWKRMIGKLDGKSVFFELAPDGFRYPDKFIIFAVKHFLNGKMYL